VLLNRYDEVHTRLTLKAEAVNALGMDDRRLVDAFVGDLERTLRTPQRAPFVDVLLLNNMHYPFLVDPDTYRPPADAMDRDAIAMARYQSALGITDRAMERIFQTLERAGTLDRTIVLFCADHGETPGQEYWRIYLPSPEVMAVPLFVWAPARLLGDAQRSALKENHDRPVSNLDIFPTLMDLLGWSDLSAYDVRPEVALRGQSLLRPVSAQRVVVGFQGPPLVWGYQNGMSSVFLKRGDEQLILYTHDWGRSTLVRIDPQRPGAVIGERKWSEVAGEERAAWLASIAAQRALPAYLAAEVPSAAAELGRAATR
jgi:arylsulfatase A-like enzyme